MKHSIEDLTDVVYRHYPRGLSGEDPGRAQTMEARRLVETRLKAGADCERWLDTERRLNDRFPGMVSGRSIHLKLGTHDACYTGSLYLPNAAGDGWHPLGFRVSVLVPYYIVYVSRVAEDRAGIAPRKARRPKPPRFATVFVDDTMHILPASLVKPELREPASEVRDRWREVSFDFSPEEQLYAAQLVHEIEATWGYEPMPPEIGNVIVPDVTTDHGEIGEATLYDCLFSDDW